MRSVLDASSGTYRKLIFKRMPGGQKWGSGLMDGFKVSVFPVISNCSNLSISELLFMIQKSCIPTLPFLICLGGSTTIRRVGTSVRSSQADFGTGSPNKRNLFRLGKFVCFCPFGNRCAERSRIKVLM